MKTNDISTDDLAQLLKGVYERVSRELGLSPYYVSRAALGEVNSKIVEEALERELKKVLARASGQNGSGARNGAGRNGRKPNTVPRSRA
jgi:hypothetical protein